MEPTMTYDLQTFEDRVTGVEEWLKKELSSVRTGRATPTLLDGVKVESYGTHVPLVQTANVGVEDARTIRVTPWDAGMVKEVEKAITNADLGVSVSVDEKGVRVIFPELTSERRTQLLKIAKGKHEEARVSLRGARDEVVRDIEAQEKAGALSNDERFTAKEELQKKVDEANKKLDELIAHKEKEVAQ